RGGRAAPPPRAGRAARRRRARPRSSAHRPTIAIIALVPVAIFARTDRLPPRLVGAVPVDGLLQPLLEAARAHPAELALDLGVVDGVATIVARPIDDEADERVRLAEQVEEGVDDLQGGPRGAAADGVDLALPAGLEEAV